MHRGEIDKFSILMGLTIGLFASSLEGTIVPIAMPRAIQELGRPELYSWPITVFILASTVSIPVWGRLSDIYGRRSVYMSGLLLFGASSLLCGVSWSLEALILFRLLQGAGSGAMFALTFTIIGDLFKLEERGRVTGYTSTVWAIGSLLGPPMGGLIVDYLGWRWVYLINVPPIAVAAVLTWRHLRGLAGSGAGRDLDLPGLILFTVIATLIVLLINGSILGREMSLVMGAALATAIPTFILVEKRMRTPFIPFKLLSVQTNLAALAINTAAGFAFFGSITVVPPLLQWVYGLKPTDAGLLLAPTTLSWVLAANVSSRLVGSSGPRTFLTVGGLTFTSALLLSILINVQTPNPYLVSLTMALVGGSMGLIVPPTLIALQTLAEPRELGFITSILTFVRSLSGAIGTQVMWAPYALIYNLETFSFVEASLATVVSFGTAALVLAVTLPFVLRVRWPDLRLYDRSRPRIQV